jgi:hypothetical protein
MVSVTINSPNIVCANEPAGTLHAPQQTTWNATDFTSVKEIDVEFAANGTTPAQYEVCYQSSTQGPVDLGPCSYTADDSGEAVFPDWDGDSDDVANADSVPCVTVHLDPLDNTKIVESVFVAADDPTCH